MPVAQNDISGDNTNLTVDKHVEVQGLDGVSVKDNMLSFTTPDSATTDYIAYTVKDKAGLSDTATLTVNASECRHRAAYRLRLSRAVRRHHR